MKPLKFFFLFISTFVFSQESGKVVAVKDGDTIVVLVEGKISKTLRLASVDCPENGQPFGKNAKSFTSSQVYGKEIEFYQTDVDMYGRTIAVVLYDEDNKSLSEEIIKAGLGWWYYQYSNDRSLGDLQTEAKYLKKGLWADADPIAPWEYRKIIKNNRK